MTSCSFDVISLWGNSIPAILNHLLRVRSLIWNSSAICRRVLTGWISRVFIKNNFCVINEQHRQNLRLQFYAKKDKIVKKISLKFFSIQNNFTAVSSRQTTIIFLYVSETELFNFATIQSAVKLWLLLPQPLLTTTQLLIKATHNPQFLRNCQLMLLHLQLVRIMADRGQSHRCRPSHYEQVGTKAEYYCLRILPSLFTDFQSFATNSQISHSWGVPVCTNSPSRGASLLLA